jgi:hypothetical protein
VKTRIRCTGLALAVIAFAPMQAYASPEFMAYEGRNAIHEGQGGEKKIVGGIEFWFNGDPPHRFKVLGAITDRRMKSGIYGAIRMSNLQADIAKAAQAAGGDAVIMQAQGDDVLGVSGFGSSYGSGSVYRGGFNASSFGSAFAAPIKAHESRYIVVKYLADETPPATDGSASGPPPTRGADASPPPEPLAPPS